jgi:hypothetical protein
MNRAILMLTLAASALALAAAPPTTAPSTAPSTASPPAVRPESAVSAPRAFPRDFDLLSQRNIFIKGRQTYSTGYEQRSFGPPASASVAVLSGPENSLIFNGVTLTESTAVAFIEDTSTNKVTIVKPGDLIARGKIISINLDSLDYQSEGGKTTRVMVGQNLAGGESTGGGNPGGGDSSGTGAGASTQPSDGGGGPTDDILERLRRKRLQELGGG